MPEYLAPGVYVEEVSFRSKSIEGVPTSTTGFAGMTRFGPVQYTGGPTSTEPRLITSFTEFERTYGGLDPLFPGGAARINFMAHAARAFFLNGGQRLYVSRVFVPNDGTGVATAAVTPAIPGANATWQARWPGQYGNVMVQVTLNRGKDVHYTSSDAVKATWGVQARGAVNGQVVEIDGSASAGDHDVPANANNLWVVNLDGNTGQQTFWQGATKRVSLTAMSIKLITLTVVVAVSSERIDVYSAVGGDPQDLRYIGKILARDNPPDENAVVWLNWTPPAANDGYQLAFGLASGSAGSMVPGSYRLGTTVLGTDGNLMSDSDLAGSAASDTSASTKATGLEALGEVDDIAIVAAPDASSLADAATSQSAVGLLIAHAEKFRYRIAVIDGPQGSSMTAIRQFRGNFDSKYAALYHPWIEILDPLVRSTQGAPTPRILLPPSGFVTGIYARSDVTRGVFKAPANEVVLGLTKFEANINKPRQDVLNPEGINALRFFQGRGNRVWGARTISSDSEWKYVNVRRLFIFIEHSIDKGTQYAVFEPNNERLWSNIRQSVEDFLLTLWRDGALLGQKPEQAFFVRCDRTTMTQNDLDNGRMICLVGVAPTTPAEFVIFRVGQFTADSQKS